MADEADGGGASEAGLRETGPPADGSQASSVAETAAPSELPPIWKRVIDVFVSPGELFERLAASPKWLAALALGAVLVALQTYLIPAEVYADMMRAQILERGQPLPPNPEDLGQMGRTFGSIFAPIGFTVVSLVITGLTTVIFAFVLGDRGTFRQYLAAASHALLIPAIGGLAITPLKISAGNPQLLLSPGNALAGLLPDGFLLDTLRFLDVFGIWGYAVLAIAMTKIDARRGFGFAFAVFLVLAVGFAMIGGAFA